LLAISVLLLFERSIKKKGPASQGQPEGRGRDSVLPKKKSRDFTPAMNVPLGIWWRNIAPFYTPSRAFYARAGAFDGNPRQTVYCRSDRLNHGIMPTVRVKIFF
jgi:hypothetical protein